MEHGYSDEKAHHNAESPSGSVEEQLETIQDDVNLLKIEIKQTLVDLREFILNSQTGFLPRVNGANPSAGPALDDQPPSDSGYSRRKVAQREEADGPAWSNRRDGPSALDHGPGPGIHISVGSGDPAGRGYRGEYREGPREEHREESRSESREESGEKYRGTSGPDGGDHSPGRSSRRQPEPAYPETLDETHQIGEIDVEMLANLLVWLDSIKGKGISPEQVRPFLQAYEARGTLTAAMSRIILQSIRAIGLSEDDSGGAEISSEEYLGYLQELHGIVCGVQPGQLPSASEPQTGIRRVKARPEEPT